MRASTPYSVPLSPPDVGELEQRYVLEAMQSGWVAPAGPDLAAFESEVAERVGRSHAVALASGTAGLHLALVSWGVGPGDVVPVSTLTFAATANAIRYVGATPHFVDAEECGGNMSPPLLERALAELERTGASVPAVVPVDLLGRCADHEAITEVTRRAGCRVLWDAAESFGAARHGSPAGSVGDAAVLSFNGNKIMTTSGGGMLLTDDEPLAAHVRKLSTQAREPVAHYEHVEVGYNYRLSNVLAALGRAQLQRFEGMMKRRRVLRERYRELFAASPGVRILGGEEDVEDNCWLTALMVDPEVSAWTADDLATSLARHGVESRPLWKPMHLQPVFSGFQATLDGTADLLFSRGLTLPSGSAMTDEQFALIESGIGEVVS